MKNTGNIPALRFPEFKEEWIQKKHGDIFSFRTTNSYSRDDLNYDDGKVKNIHYGDIHTKFNTLFDITKEAVPFINSGITLKNIAEDNYCKEGDLLIADASEDYANVGKCVEIVNLNGEKVLSGLHTILARPDLYKMAHGFNGYLMKSENIRLQIKTIAQGSKVLSISSKRLAGISICIPQIPEQQKIATFLTAIDDKLTQLKKKKSLIEQYKKGVMQKIFTQELRFKDDDDKEFPKWEMKRLGAIGETYNGLTGKTKENFGKGKPYIQYKQIFDDSKIDISRFELVEIGAKEHQNRVLFGDVFFTVSSETPNEIGTASVLIDKVEELYLNSFCFGYRANSLEILSPYFSQYLFRSELFRNDIMKLAQGSTRYNMSKVQLMKLEIFVPCLKEQINIANFLSAIDEKISHTIKQIEKTEQWKKGLLQKMFV